MAFTFLEAISLNKWIFPSRTCCFKSVNAWFSIYGQMGVRYWWLGSNKFIEKMYLKLHNIK